MPYYQPPSQPVASENAAFENEHDNEMDELILPLNVQFEDQYIQVVKKYLNYFSKENLPLKISVPIQSPSLDILHPKIHEWIESFSFTDLARLRQISNESLSSNSA